MSQRREALAVNRITKFSKSLGCLLVSSKSEDFAELRPQLRRCQSEEILPSWDHFADPSLGLLSKKIPIVSQVEQTKDGNLTPEGSPVINRQRNHSYNKRHTIVLESASVVTAGTIDSLVTHLTDVQYITGTQYMEYFLFTYRYFMNADKLLEKLKETYIGIPPPDLSPEEADEHEKRLPLQKLRVINILKKWVENHMHDFSDVQFVSKFLAFLEQVVAYDNQKWAEHLKKTVENRILKSINDGKASDDMKRWTVKTVKLKDLQTLMTIAMVLRRSEIVATRKKNLRSFKHSFHGNEALDWLASTFHIERGEALNLANQLTRAGFIKHHSETNNTAKEKPFKDKDSLYFCNSTLTTPEAEYPKPIRPKTATFSFLELHPLEVARQLTLIEFKIFEKINTSELSHQVWNKKNAKEIAPNVTALIERCNEIAYWVATEIVMTPNMKQRVSVLTRFIAIAEICYEFRNWNTLMELMVGLNLGCITRLKKTWEALPKHASVAFDQLSKVTSASQNYVHYREALATKELPFAPNLAVHLRDLTFIEDGNEDTIGGLINFSKMHMLGAVFEEIHRLQTTPYHFKEIKAINKYLTSGLFVLRGDKELYKRSNSCEPSVRSLSTMLNKSKSGRFLTLRSSITKSV